ncbi:MAG TPA: sigma-70 family RNA polymerase sigma factor [Steroidobacteraceae bacterium]|nr:sigma-70 family RNA polymerase sigma factor [Steroidobacteraceae bacterium]
MKPPARQDTFVTDVAERYGDDLLRFLSRRTANAADARDVAQETYTRLLRVERKDLIENPQAYLYRVAANLIYEQQLKRRNDAAGLKRWTEERQHDVEPIGTDRAADAMFIRARMGKVLDQLSPKCRAVIILHRRDGLTYEEIGKHLGISARMVKKYLSIGLRHCREKLRGME